MTSFLKRVALVVLVLACVAVAPARAGQIGLGWGPTGDLAQGTYWMWGFNPQNFPLNGEYIVSFEFIYLGLYEGSYPNNHLETDLLNATFPDHRHGFYQESEPAASAYLKIWEFSGVTTTPTNYSSGVVTDPALVALLSAQWQTGWVGFGIDPDCHFGDSGLWLKVNTAPVPEPATLTLLGAGLAGVAAVLRRRRRS